MTEQPSNDKEKKIQNQLIDLLWWIRLICSNLPYSECQIRSSICKSFCINGLHVKRQKSDDAGPDDLEKDEDFTFDKCLNRYSLIANKILRETKKSRKNDYIDVLNSVKEKLVNIINNKEKLKDKKEESVTLMTSAPSFSPIFCAIASQVPVDEP